MKQSIKTECSSCSGTGVYVGFAEAKGTAVICLYCDGTGACTIEYTPFTSLKKRKGVATVSRSRGTFIGTGVGAYGSSVSYEDFLKGKRP
jgi:hypothetical protein